MNQKSCFQKLAGNQKGQGLTEYVVLLVLVVIVSLGVVKTFGTTLKGRISAAESQVSKLRIANDALD